MKGSFRECGYNCEGWVMIVMFNVGERERGRM